MRNRSPEPGTMRRRRLRPGLLIPAAGLALGVAALAAFWSVRRPREVVPFCGDCLALNPKSFEAEMELGQFEYAGARYEEAVRHLKSAIALKPGAYAPYPELAKALVGMGHFGEAREVLKRAKGVGNYAEGKKSFITQGYAGMQMGHPVQAESAFRRAIAVDPRDPMGYHHMGVYLLSRGKNREAESYFRKALSMDYGKKYKQHLDTFDHFIPLCLARKRFGEAEDLIKDALALERQAKEHGFHDHESFHVKFLLYLGKTYEGKGDLSAAESAIQRALRSPHAASQTRRLYAELQKLYEAKGDLSAAERVLQRAIRSSNVGVAARVRFLQRLSNLYAREGKNVDAMKAAAESKNLFKSRVSDLSRRARTYTQKGMFAQAENARRELIRLNSLMPPSLELAREEEELIKVLRREGQLRKAELWMRMLHDLFVALHRPRDAARTRMKIASLRREMDRGVPRHVPGSTVSSKNDPRQTQAKR